MWRHFAGRDFPLEGFCERLFPAEGFELGGISPHSQRFKVTNIGKAQLSSFGKILLIEEILLMTVTDPRIKALTQ